MDVTFVQHAQYNVDRDHGGQNKPELIVRGGQKGAGCALKLGAQGRGQAEFAFLFLHGAHGCAQRRALRHIEGKGGHGELPLPGQSQLHGALFHLGDAGEGYGLAVPAGNVNMLQILRRATEMFFRFQHHFVLVGLGKDGGNEPLAQGVVKGVVHIIHVDAQASGGVTVDFHPGHAPGGQVVAGDGVQFRPPL